MSCPLSYRESVGLKNATWYVDEERRECLTQFDDGPVVPAHPVIGYEHVARARSLGYEGSDEDVVWAMTREHDLVHSILAEAEGWRFSPTLHGVGSGAWVPAAVADREEALALCVVRLLNRVRKSGGLLA